MEEKEQTYNRFVVVLTEYIKELKSYRFYKNRVENFQKEPTIEFSIDIPITLNNFISNIITGTKFSHIHYNSNNNHIMETNKPIITWDHIMNYYPDKKQVYIDNISKQLERDFKILEESQYSLEIKVTLIK